MHGLVLGFAEQSKLSVSDNLRKRLSSLCGYSLSSAAAHKWWAGSYLFSSLYKFLWRIKTTWFTFIGHNCDNAWLSPCLLLASLYVSVCLFPLVCLEPASADRSFGQCDPRLAPPSWIRQYAATCGAHYFQIFSTQFQNLILTHLYPEPDFKLLIFIR